MYDWIIKWEAVINDGLQPTLFIWIEQQYEKPHNSDVSGWPVTKIFILSFLIDAETLLIKKKEVTGRHRGSPCYISLKMAHIIACDSRMGFEDSLASLLCQ